PHISAVAPKSLEAFTSAPAARIARTASMLPLSAAYISGVVPRLSRVLASLDFSSVRSAGRLFSRIAVYKRSAASCAIAAPASAADRMSVLKNRLLTDCPLLLHAENRRGVAHGTNMGKENALCRQDSPLAR